MKKALACLTILFFAPFGCVVDPGFVDDGTFTCSSNDDCEDQYICNGGQCVREVSNTCVDQDQDGYGVGETGDCPACTGPPGICDEDCDDSDPDVNPGAADVCDGKDNDCSEDTSDGQVNCETPADCPTESGLLQDCPEDVCVYTGPDQVACPEPIACVDGDRTVPDNCQ